MKFTAFVASDIDGTLLFDGQTELDPALFAEIRRLREKGVLFCAASGRPLYMLHELFAPVADEIAYMSENAAYIYYGHEQLNVTAMPRDLCAELVAYLGTRTDCVSRACTTTGRYYFVLTAAAQAQLDAVGIEFANSQVVKDFSAVRGDVTQISAISAGDMNIPAKEILPAWQDRIGAAVTGEHWLDFTAAGKDKGLYWLCDHFGIPRENTYAFGDSYNDVPMLDAAAHAYLMASGAPGLQAKYPLKTDDVLSVLRTL